MTNIEISKLLKNVAASYSIKDEKKYRFQILAYEKAADSIANLPTELNDLYKDHNLKGIVGIGPTIQSRLEELFKTGKVKHFEDVMTDIPEAVFPLLDIPSFGPKKAYKLATEFNLKNSETVVTDLEKIAKKGDIAGLEGFGEKSQSDILRTIGEYKLGKTKTARMALPYANELAQIMMAYLKKSHAVLEVYPLGSLRRKRDTIGDIDIAVATNKPQEVLDYFTAYPYKERIIERGDRTSSILVSSGKQIDLMVQPPDGFGALLQHFTGSKAHNVHLREYALSKGLSVSDFGIKKKGDNKESYKLYKTEESFYKALGMQWVPPEIRENTGEIELALQYKLPKLVELSDIKGDFHLHSSFPIEESHDAGQNSMEELINKALKLGYTYLGFSEHNPSTSNHTNEQILKLLEKRGKYIEQLKLLNKKDIRIFSLLETDILPSGKLAIQDSAFDYLDATIVSIHSSFSMKREEMTERVLKGLSHPKAKIFAHPTSRLINQRSPIELDFEKIFTYCIEHNKALEINAAPQRLDLTDILVREAVKKGVKMFINTDSHATDQMDLMKYGITVARRGWATKRDILNTKEYNELDTWFRGGE
ncbi:MAG TPA: PHP domain-containing protein [Candidatus Sulfotelmatobacter sp.]|jgi:DNA polymerase (family 10)|nr:PHP domain-containing protein [Candidatus Sulfotelmatobacter sp.]